MTNYDKLDSLENILKANKLSYTKPRRLVFEAIKRNAPLSMNELVGLCFHQIDRATVYRIVELYERLDIIHKLQIGWKYKLELSDIFNTHHHHLSCTSCGKIIDIEHSKEVEDSINILAKSKNFQVSEHQIEVLGICNDCQKKIQG